MEVTTLDPEQADRRANAQTAVQVGIRRQGGIQGGTEIIMFLLGNEDPFGLVSAIQVTLRLFGILGKVSQMTVQELGQLTRLSQLFLPKLADRFKQMVTRLLGTRLGDHQGLI